MAKRATISITTPTLLRYNGSTDYKALVEQMKNYWTTHLARILPDKPDLIILPECCDRYEFTPFPNRTEYYEARGETMLEFFSDIAKANNCYIAYSAVRHVNDDPVYPWRNSTQIIGRDGKVVGIYDKNHLVTAENTVANMAYGKTSDLIKLDFADAACAICFDLNFDELLEKYERQKPKLVIFSSMYNGGRRQEEWAYRCRAYFASAIAREVSHVLNPFGEVVATNTNYYPFMTAKVNFDYVIPHIDHNSSKFAAVKQKYGDAVTIHDPGYVGCVMMTCEDDSMCIDDIVKEFEIELMDDYFARCLKHREAHI